MGRKQKIITICLWLVLFLVVLGVTVAKMMPMLPPRHAEMPVLFEASRFALVDQDGKDFAATDLRGKAYICDFIFTTCGSACPVMTHKLAEVQGETPAELQLVSFTVNPEHDTPAVLKEYAKLNNADLGRWHFLTGTPAQMTQVVHEMKIGYQAAAGSDPILHSEKFLLVDGDGNVRGIYDSLDAQAMKALVADATWLAKSSHARGS
jgi:protein SCO1/2